MAASHSRVLLVQAGTPPDEIRLPHGDWPAWFSRALDLPEDAIEVVRVFEDERLPRPDHARIGIITGSWSMVTDREPWSEAAAAWIREAMALDMPLFGVCYGHQLMTHALGGQVDYHPGGSEIGCQTVRLSPEAAGDPFLTAAPAQFVAHFAHSQTVIAPPVGAQVLASSDHDRHQILRYGPNAVSVQFHPEFTPAISSAVIRLQEKALRAEGKHPASLLNAVTEAFEPQRMLRRFVADTMIPAGRHVGSL